MTKRYLSGFRNYHQSEALADTLPIGQNTPQKVSHGLYAEQLSGTAFTVPRANNLHSWLYRIRPSVVQGKIQPHPRSALFSAHDFPSSPSPEAMRWSPIYTSSTPNTGLNFIDGLIPVAMSGAFQDPAAALYLYAIQKTSPNTFFCDTDGELLWIPQQGELQLNTEFGQLHISPGEIAIIPRGVRFRIQLNASQATGYLCENYKAPFSLPELGPIGANGLANTRDFCTPVAHYEDKEGEFQLITKYQQHLWTTELTHSPLDVVAWHGNYAPCCYSLKHFNTINTVSFDHTDPSIFTVLTSQSENLGTANLDFVIFPDRWMVAEHTFRLPYYHRNIMSELMGLIEGQYDAKEKGFEPGGISLHNSMTPHGPDAQGFNQASEHDLQPQRYQGTLAFMLETRQIWHVTNAMLNHSKRQNNYPACWQDLKKNFKL